AKMYQMSGGQFNIPIVFRGPTGNAGQLGAQHSQNFENWYANTPGLKVVIPSNPYDAKGLLKTSIRDDDPVIFMESELMYGDKGEVPEEEYLIPIGKSKVIHEGKDVTLISFGKMMKVAEEAYHAAKKENIDVELIDLRSVRPIDYNSIINSVKKTNRLVIIEEAWPLASISSEISHHVQRFAFDYLDAPVHRITCEDVPFHYAPTLIKEIIPNVDKAMKAIKAVTYK
ncbi:MAG: transketolase C-terminal domain-containing protein, partial [Bacteroidota bacterium]|nr:transketolase C-terminal domain-containing protein [Bacteroidota bacterium]